MIRPGELDRRWNLRQLSTTQNDYGEDVQSYSTLDTVWGSWEPLKGNEKWTAQQFVERAEARVKIRYRSDIDGSFQLQNDELGTFEIIGEPEQRRREGTTVMQVSRII